MTALIVYAAITVTVGVLAYLFGVLHGARSCALADHDWHPGDDGVRCLRCGTRS
jgi:hypothetical protein